MNLMPIFLASVIWAYFERYLCAWSQALIHKISDGEMWFGFSSTFLFHIVFQKCYGQKDIAKIDSFFNVTSMKGFKHHITNKRWCVVA